MKKLDLLELLNEELKNAENHIALFCGDNNPQVLELYYIEVGKRNTLEATIHYIKTGSKNYF